MYAKKRILVVDDDQEIRELLDEYLTRAGYTVVLASEGEEMKRHLLEGEPDLILLDVMLPGEDGFSLCQYIRRSSNVPIIMLTAVSDETDQIVGLEIGADDYVAKPFSPRQLTARIKAMLRRTRAVEVPKAKPQRITFSNWTLHVRTHTLTDIDTGNEIELSGKDFTLLMLFLDHPNQILDRDSISQVMKGRNALPTERGLDVQLSRLRNQLGDSGKKPKLIKTMRGDGYILAADVIYDS
ncbi:DNA-binding response regulator [Vibrio sp. MACH09]|uniref:response regulator n=1 Tax=unclassified Vibrio TaxID=2614977 RepID=UPI0014935830|nr:MULTISPECIES: response regulator transcription factor [unclassified Vibrio]NOI66366.1 response regulator transcription factor [Vibrio sp. 99-8-1]GLO60413.1 DNA-binding response regulator [Vibrio sp. MACH09]